jgi:hypothetical protein
LNKYILTKLHYKTYKYAKTPDCAASVAFTIGGRCGFHGQENPNCWIGLANAIASKQPTRTHNVVKSFLNNLLEQKLKETLEIFP